MLLSTSHRGYDFRQFRSALALTLLTIGLLLVFAPRDADAQAAPPVDRELFVRLDAALGIQPDAQGRVGTWPDQELAGGANDATESNLFFQPILVSDAGGGFPAVRFDGGNDRLAMGAAQAFETDTITWFVVMRINALPPGGSADVGTILNASYSGGAGALSNRIWGSFVNLNGVLGSFARGVTGQFTGPSTTASVGGFFVLSAVWDSADQVTQFIDGVSSGTEVGADSAPSGHIRTQIGALENPINTLTRFLDGDIAEILIYGTDLSTSERQSVESYLADKYAVDGSFLPINVAVTAPEEGTIVSGSGIPLTATADNATQVDFFVAGSLVGSDTEAPFAATFDSTLFTDGTAQVTVEASNALGSTVSDPVGIVIDNSSPVIGISMPEPGDVLGGTVDFTATATDVNGIQSVNFLAGASLDVFDADDPFGTLYDTTLDPDGETVLAIVVLDGAGNVAEDEITVIVDNTDPVIAITNPCDDQVVSGTIPIEADVDDANLERVEFSAAGNVIAVDEDPSDGFATTFDTTTVPDGGLGIEAVATDAAGNSARFAITVQVENTVPANLIRRPGDQRRVRGCFAIRVRTTGVDAEIVTTQVFVDSELVFETPCDVFTVIYDSRTVVDGPLVITAVSEDVNGTLYVDEITVTVRNLRLRLCPRRLKLSSTGDGEPVRLRLRGPSVGLLAPVADHGLTLAIEGAGSLAATGGDTEPVDCVLYADFDRLDLISLINSSFAETPRKVTFQVFADGRLIGKTRLRVKP